MRFKQVQPMGQEKKYRLYSHDKIADAYTAVRVDGLSIRGAARRYGIPAQTLRDRLTGRTNIDCVTTGRAPIFDIEEEAKLVKHLDSVAELGYGYTRQEVVDIASDYAVQLGKRNHNNPLTLNWFETFRTRWPPLGVLKPRSLEISRAKGASIEIVSKYFDELEHIMNKYNMQSTPHLIYNVDEKGFMPNHTPPYIVSSTENRPQAVTSGKGNMTTVIGAGSATGVAVPPFFVFAGARLMPDLLKDASPGTEGTVSLTGWSNTDIFRHYLKEHFIKFIPNREPGQHLLLILDGHLSHVAVDIVDWAKSQGIILFILPAHTSHILQPLDISCYGPVERIYSNLCHKFMRGNSSSYITRYDICGLACKAYGKGLIPDNLYSGFKKAGIYPFDKSVIDPSSLAPATVFAASNTASVVNSANVHVEESLQSGQEKNSCEEEQNNLCPDQAEEMEDSVHTAEVSPSKFLSEKLQRIKSVKGGQKKNRKPRKSVSKVVSGKAITETQNFRNLKQYIETSTSSSSTKMQKKKSVKGKQPASKKSKTQKKPQSKSKQDVSNASPQPGPSYFYVSDSSASSDDEIQDSEKCCVCSLFTPKEIRESNFFQLTQWVQCDSCPHWVHLKFCTSIRVVRRGDPFHCIHCIHAVGQPSEE